VLLKKVKIRLIILIILLLAFIIITNTVNLSFLVQLLDIKIFPGVFSSLFSTLCTFSACLGLYGNLENEDDPFLRDPIVFILCSIAAAILFDIMIVINVLQGNYYDLYGYTPITISLSIGSIGLNFILVIILVKYHKKFRFE